MSDINKALTKEDYIKWFNAIESGELKQVQWWINNGIDFNIRDKEDFTPLMLSCRDGLIDIVEELLKYKEVKKSINNQKKDKFTAFMIAAVNDRLDICKLLIEHKANPNLTDKYQKNALLIALDEVTPENETISYLIEKCGAKGSDMTDWTALHFACRDNRPLGIIRKLIKYGANVNAKSVSGLTPIMVACENNFIPLVEFLLLCGADLSIVDENGRTAIDYISSIKLKEIVNSWLESESEM